MVNPGDFVGLWRDFVLGEKEAYSKGIKGSFAADALAIIQHQYFKWFSIALANDDEPSAKSLEVMNDNEPDPEWVAPDPDALNNKEYAATLGEVEQWKRTISYYKAVRTI